MWELASISIHEDTKELISARVFYVDEVNDSRFSRKVYGGYHLPTVNQLNLETATEEQILNAIKTDKGDSWVNWFESQAQWKTRLF